jgi:hypothetical protein
LGTLDNYNTHVRSALESEREVGRLNREIQRLQNSSQSQGAAINRLGRQSGTTPPQFYQNYGGYYPGIPR